MSADLLVIAPYTGGHHAEYVRWMVSAGAERGLDVALAAAPALLAGAPDLRTCGGGAVHALGAAGALETASSVAARVRATRRVLAEAARVPARQALLTYLDAALPALALPSREPVPDRMAGLLFRPPFREADPWAGRLRLAARRALLARVARGPVETVLTLDAAAVPALERIGARAAALPDPAEPVAPRAPREAVRETFGVEDGRVLAVLFGSLEERKGLFALADAVRRLPAPVARRLAVVVVGRTYDAIRSRVTAALAEADAGEAQVVFRETFLADADLADLTAAADLVLAPYVEHVGSSGVVARAAAAGVPLVAQAGGQVGREVRAHRLGRTVDPTDVDALADTLAAAVDDPRGAFDLDAARAYAEAHTVDRFTDALYVALGHPAP